jgi:hypothetical protein
MRRYLRTTAGPLGSAEGAEPSGGGMASQAVAARRRGNWGNVGKAGHWPFPPVIAGPRRGNDSNIPPGPSFHPIALASGLAVGSTRYGQLFGVSGHTAGLSPT